MDLAALKSEIMSGPLKDTLAPFVAVRNDAAIAAALNNHTIPSTAPIPIEILSAYCCKEGVTGGVMAMLEIPIGASDNFPSTLSVATKGKLHTVMTLLQNDLRLSTADVADPVFGVACDGLIGLGVMTSQQKAGIVALGNITISRAEQAFGQPVTVDQVSAALNMGA